MADVDNVFLTDTRREVLKGEYDGSPNNQRSHKSNIRKRADLALEELIEVAESDELDHTDFIDPDDVFRLLQALLIPDRHHIDRDEFTPTPTEDQYTDEFRAYRDRLQKQMGKLILEDDLP